MISIEKKIAFSQFRYSYETKMINDILSILLPKFVRNRINESNCIISIKLK